jgi:hypothetical protein
VVEDVVYEGPMPRMSRSTAFAVGAVIFAGAVTLEACSQPVYGAPIPPTDSAVADDASVDAPNDTGGGGVRYGAPPPDGG